MKLVGLMPVRNEDWILGLSLRVALKWCDEVIVYLHACTDQSAAIAMEVAQETNRVVVVAQTEDKWDEMTHRQATLELARTAEVGATHIALIDADEVLTANLTTGDKPIIRDLIASTPAGVMLELPGYNLRQKACLPEGSAWAAYHANGIWAHRWFATAFQDSPGAHWGGDRFHHREPMGVYWAKNRPIQQGYGGTLHFWGASERRLRAKHALYKITERIRFPQKPIAEIENLYNLAIIPREPWHFADLNPTWLFPDYLDWIEEHLDVDAEPWQEGESKRLYQEYGAPAFDGLDLFGVV